MIRVLLADDHALILEAMQLLVERIEGVKVVASARNGRDALRLAKEHRPDLAIMDIEMEQLNGIDAAAQLRTELPETRILILSSHTDERSVHRAVRAGVAGYLVKTSLSGELAAAVKAIMQGDTYLSPAISTHVMSGLSRARADESESRLESLSPRQREVLQMLAEGRSTKEIAFTLGLSVKTVETHRAAIMERLDIRDLPGLVLFAADHGLVSGRPARRSSQ
jgi:DNA-binding NarL/FixJ family response regulator